MAPLKTRSRNGIADLLGIHRLRPDRYPYLLRSAASGTAQGRYDILFAFPGESLVLGGRGNQEALPDFDFLEQFDQALADEALPPNDNTLPFRGGWFLFLSYELAAQVEPTLKLTTDPLLPVAFATRVPAAFVVDHAEHQTWLVAETGHEDKLVSMQDDLDAAKLPGSKTGPVLAAKLDEEPPDRYLEAVERARRYIYDGDIFQANLSRLWRGRAKKGISAADLYERLCAANPAPFSGLAIWQDSAIISSSPERLLRLSHGLAETRPIAGTRPRGLHRQQDQALSRELLAHPKERAEHIMLIDLERNDLGRVCEAGSVEVNELMVIESYAHVHHIVSNVRGRLQNGVTPGQAIRAMFPGGTITGCPKVRCMEIIDELEAGTRGAYTGSIGYVNRDGSADLNILIRTLVLDGDRITLRAGGGIVADSIPEAELAESRAKAKGMVLALEARS